jgi:hypothetical protein
MAAFLSHAPIRGFVSAGTPASVTRELVLASIARRPVMRCRPVRHWNRAPDGRLVSHWRPEAVVSPPPH